jgi:glycosyltransferase involved in cell wall biosynthesis
MSKNLLSEKKVIIASYTHIVKGEYTTIGGPALAIKDYLKSRVKCLVCVWQPVPISDTLSAIEEVFENGKEIRKRRFYIINWPFGREKEISFIYVALKLRDILATFYFALKANERFDIFIGVESLNALIGVLLRRLGVVKTVIYYNLDYGEIRFKNPILNYLFHALDKLAVNHVDYTWNLAEEMINARKRRGILKKGTESQLIVPIGIDLSRVKPLNIEQINRKTIAYLGLLAEKQGVQLLVEALPEIVKRVEGVHLMFIGSGPLEASLKKAVKEYNLEERVTFTGLVSDEEVERLLCKCSVGIAPYFPDPNSTKKFTDPTKPKMYLACGLPVIITRVPPMATEIEKRRAGLAIKYDKNELAEAVSSLLADEKTYLEYRKNAINFAQQYDWSNILDKAFSYNY